MMQRLLIGLVKAYRLLLSPWLGSVLPLRAHLLRLCHRGARAARRGRRQLSHAAPHRALPALVRGRPRSGSPEGTAPDAAVRARCSPFSLPTTRSLLHERYPPHHPVGDLWFLAGAAVGPMAGLQRQASRPSCRRPSRPRRRTAPAGRRRRRPAPAACRRASVPPARQRQRRRRRRARRHDRGAAPARRSTVTTDVLQA